MDLSIIIINWKSVAYLRNCLKSVFQQVHEFEYEVIVVDNDSGDHCREILAEEFPSVKCVESKKNLGFSGGNNLGFTYSSGHTLLFLNPDTEIRGNAVGVLYSTLASSPKIGAVGGMLLNTDLSLQTSCVLPFPTILRQLLDIEWLKRKFPESDFWGIRPLLGRQKGPAAVEALSGACLMVRRDVFESIGRFSTDYFMYAEDIDLCYKIHESGLKVVYVNSAHVVHHGGGSTKNSRQLNFNSVLMRQANLIFLKKHRSAGYAFAYRLSTGMAAVVRMLLLSPLVPRVGTAGIRKWFGIFRWSLGLEAWSIHPSL